MILTNRRHRILFITLSGLEVAWFLPFLLLGTSQWLAPADDRHLALWHKMSAVPLASFLILWLLMLFYMLASDLLEHARFDSPLREIAIIAMVGATSVVAIWILFPPDTGAFIAGLLGILGAFFDLNRRSGAEYLLVVTNAYLWIRVAMMADRDLSFFSVGVSFRLGMLLSIAANTLLSVFSGLPAWVAVELFSAFLLFGLLAVALARIDEKAVGAYHSTGSLLPWSRLAYLVATSLVILGMTLELSAILTTATIRRALSWLSPVWLLLRWLLVRLLYAVFVLLTPLLERLASYLQGIAVELPEQPPPSPLKPEYVSITTIVRDWTILRYCLVTGAFLLAIGIVLVFFVRIRERIREEEEEEQELEEIGLASARFPWPAERLRDWWNLFRRYGVSRSLLAAVTVQNLYANLGRVARRRGYPRRPAQAPDSYLVDLERAFPNCESELSAITQAYMRVHYGEQPVATSELTQLQAQYRRALAVPFDDT